MVKPLAYAAVELRFRGQVIAGHCEHDGFFRFEWSSPEHLPAGRHEVTVACVVTDAHTHAVAEGYVLVPHVTQYAFISDIDDTIMRSYSATIFRRLYELLRHNPERRRLFTETVSYYHKLATTHTRDELSNPFFYVSSSEWNLFDYLQRTFHYNRLPEGVFLLNQIKRWFELFRTGKTGHSGKLMRIARILAAFPQQQFVLLGDNSQDDPKIYKAIAERHPGKIYAVYIRNVRPSRSEETTALLASLEARNQVEVCLFSETADALAHAQRIGLL